MWSRSVLSRHRCDPSVVPCPVRPFPPVSSCLSGSGVSRVPSLSLSAVLGFGLTASVALGGGGLAALAGVPAAWLSGAALASALAAIAGLPVQVPGRIRTLCYVALGATLGSGVTPGVFSEMGNWGISLTAVGVTVVAVVWASLAFLSRVAGWDRASALFASVPGALSYVLAMASEDGRADVRRVAVSQTLRLLVLVVVLPPLIAHGVASVPDAPLRPESGVRDLVILALVSALASFLAMRARLPAGHLTGPFFASLALHATGAVSGGLPAEVTIPAYACLGAIIGARFTGIRLAEFRAIAGASLGAFGVALVVSLGIAALVSVVTGQPLALTLVAFAPGALDAMVVLAFALHMDPAYVALHQMLRMLLISFGLPLVVRLFLPPGAADRDTGPH